MPCIYLSPAVASASRRLTGPGERAEVRHEGCDHEHGLADILLLRLT